MSYYDDRVNETDNSASEIEYFNVIGGVEDGWDEKVVPIMILLKLKFPNLIWNINNAAE